VSKEKNVRKHKMWKEMNDVLSADTLQVSQISIAYMKT